MLRLNLLFQSHDKVTIIILYLDSALDFYKVFFIA